MTYDWDGQTAVLQLLASRSARVSAQAAKGLLSDSAAGRQGLIDFLVPRALADNRASWSEEERARLVSAMWVRDEAGYAHPPSRVG